MNVMVLLSFEISQLFSSQILDSSFLHRVSLLLILILSPSTPVALRYYLPPTFSNRNFVNIYFLHLRLVFNFIKNYAIIMNS